MDAHDPAPTNAPSHEEFLRVPLGWWVILGFLLFTLVVAVWAILNTTWALATLALFGLVIAVVLTRYGDAAVRADDRGLYAAGARIAWQYVSGARALDDMGTRRATAVAANGRTWLLIRPYLSRSVLVDIVDHADPHEHWLIGTRHPEELAEAIRARAAAPAETVEAPDADGAL